ncbi:MAG: DNA-directed RNA polymerase subunit B'' [Candidatus Micrarchaeaceae archaeon]
MSNELIESFLSTTSIVQQQIDSFNKFINFGLQEIVDRQATIVPNVEGFSLKLGKVRLDKPSIIEADSSRRTIMPNEARLRNLTYAAPIFIHVTPVIRGVEKADAYGEVFVGELPIMVKSDLCNTKGMPRERLIEDNEDPDDPGGYFIIKGTERVLIGLEDLAPNRIITTKESGGTEVVSKVFSTSPSFRARCTVTRNQHGMFYVNFPTSAKNIQFALLLRALGMQEKEAISLASDVQAVANDIIINFETSDANNIGPSEALLALGQAAAPGQAKEYQLKRIETQIDTYLLPHIGTSPELRKQKAKYLVEMAKKASLVANKYLRQDDKDHYANKRIKLSGVLMEELFAYAFKFFVKDVKYQIERTSARGRRLNLQTIISPDTITEKILYAMGTGTWPTGQTGVSQVLETTNLISAITHIRRVKSPLAKKHPHFKARDVHGTQWGKICPSETPEGIEVGLTKYLALMAKVSIGAKDDQIENTIKENIKINAD